MNKIKNRFRRMLSFRFKIKKFNVYRLVVHRSSNHIYAQIISFDRKNILVSASTVEKNIKKKLNCTGNKFAAFLVGKVIAIRSLKKGIKFVTFDRCGFKYHGRIKELADSARKFGLNF